jgi:hypothetical protein
MRIYIVDTKPDPTTAKIPADIPDRQFRANNRSFNHLVWRVQAARAAPRREYCSPSDDIALEGGVMLREPHVPLQHVIPIHQRQAGHFDPPANPMLLGGVERQGGRDFPAVDELR